MKPMKMPARMPAGQFTNVPRATIPRSQFNRSHTHKTTFDAGYIVPIYVDEALPGDTFNLRLSAFIRMATPIKPLMDNLWLDVFFFAVPYRLVWANFVKFMGEQVQPGDSISYTVPQSTVPAAGYNLGTLHDYFGLPVGLAPGSPAWSHSCLWTRAYYLIYNQWFRDENLCAGLNGAGQTGTLPTGDGPDTYPVGGPALVKRTKRHDYFTSCLPWPQKGTAVSIPLGTSAPVVSDGASVAPTWRGATSGYVGNMQATTAANPSAVRISASGTLAAGENLNWEDPNLVADLSTATAATINALRQAFQIQKLLERDARGGTRYTEIIKSHFGVTSPDARLQRAEYLGGGTIPISVQAIANNQSTPIAGGGAGTPSTPQGNLAGVATGATAGGIGFVKSFTEHCLLLGLVSARADLTYQQGLDRMWSRSTRYDFYWPALAQIGEQAVLNKELYVQGTAADANTFGYQERYAEYRYSKSRITGKFRSGVSGTLEIWHLAQQFGALPTLNQTFIEESVPMSRVLAVSSEPHFLFDSYFDLKCARPMPVYGIPGMIDHF